MAPIKTDANLFLHACSPSLQPDKENIVFVRVCHCALWRRGKNKNNLVVAEKRNPPFTQKVCFEIQPSHREKKENQNIHFIKEGVFKEETKERWKRNQF